MPLDLPWLQVLKDALSSCLNADGKKWTAGTKTKDQLIGDYRYDYRRGRGW